MKNIILLVLSGLILSGCGIDHDDYFVRWWNGNIPSKLSPKEQKIWDMCYGKIDRLPQSTKEEREKAREVLRRCVMQKTQELGIK